MSLPRSACTKTYLLVVTESHLEVFIPRSKTDQLWKGAWVAVGGIGGPACPVVRLVTRLLEQGEYRRQLQAAAEDVGLGRVAYAPKFVLLALLGGGGVFWLAVPLFPFFPAAFALCWSSFRDAFVPGCIRSGMHSFRDAPVGAVRSGVVGVR
jgi:hypothetical protein